MNAVLGGAFDPPHNGHVELARAALESADFQRLYVEVVADPAHKKTYADAGARLEMARAAFEDLPGAAIELEPNPYTVDAVRTGRFADAVFLIGADEAKAFLSWKDPDEIVKWVRLGVANRSGYAQADLVARYGDRVWSFEIDSPPISSRQVRELVAQGRPIGDLVPPKVEAQIEGLGLYRGYTPERNEEDLTTR